MRGIRWSVPSVLLTTLMFPSKLSKNCSSYSFWLNYTAFAFMNFEAFILMIKYKLDAGVHELAKLVIFIRYPLIFYEVTSYFIIEFYQENFYAFFLF